MEKNDQVRIGIMEIAQAENLRTRLAKKDVLVELMHNQQTCTKGCKISVEIWAHLKDLPKISDEFDEQRSRLLDGLEVNPALLDQIHSPENEHSVCPACGANFSSKLLECPDCGLAFAALV